MFSLNWEGFHSANFSSLTVHLALCSWPDFTVDYLAVRSLAQSPWFELTVNNLAPVQPLPVNSSSFITRLNIDWVAPLVTDPPCANSTPCQNATTLPNLHFYFVITVDTIMHIILDCRSKICLLRVHISIQSASRFFRLKVMPLP